MLVTMFALGTASWFSGMFAGHILTMGAGGDWDLGHVPVVSGLLDDMWGILGVIQRPVG